MIRLTAGKYSKETTSFNWWSNICNDTRSFSTVSNDDFNMALRKSIIPIEIVDELPAAWRKRNMINISTFGETASPILAIRNSCVGIVRRDPKDTTSKMYLPEACTARFDADLDSLPKDPILTAQGLERPCSSPSHQNAFQLMVCVKSIYHSQVCCDCQGDDAVARRNILSYLVEGREVNVASQRGECCREGHEEDQSVLIYCQHVEDQ